MKSFITIIVFFISLTLSSQNPIEKNVGDFNELKVYDLIEVKLVKSDVNKVIISGNNRQDVVIDNKNGKLKVKMNIEEIFDGNMTSVLVYYTNIETIDVNEGAFVSSEEIFKQFDIELKAQEGGSIKLNLNTTYTTIKAVTGGVIETYGTSKNQDISISTGGIYEGKELESETTKIAIRVAGEAYVKATELVDIKIRVGGDVYIYGNPKKVIEDKVIGGRIKHMN
jgi:hypothetical protein